jgi:hypothetical protein
MPRRPPCNFLRAQAKWVFKMDDYLNPISNLYKNNLLKFGVDSKSVGWKNNESQNLRFQVLNRVIKDAEGSYSVNDYGSGYGAHLTNLLESGYKINTYNAYDINIGMLEQLSEIHKTSNRCQINTIHSPEISTHADYSFVSGTFNVKPSDDTNRWEKEIRLRLQQLKAYSRRGFAFNLLSTYVDWKSEELYYADPLLWFDYCKTEISSKVVLFHDYELYEWTILCSFDEKKMGN